MVCDKVMCMCKFVCVKLWYVRDCVCDKVIVCVSEVEAGGGRSEAEQTRGTESKTRTPHKVVGKKKKKNEKDIV